MKEDVTMVSSKDINDYFSNKLGGFENVPYIFKFGEAIDWEKIKKNFETVLELVLSTHFSLNDLIEVTPVVQKIVKAKEKLKSENDKN